MSEFCLEISSANKSFPGVKALDQASFRLRKGSIHALLGENGAGKSTLIKIITGVHKQDSGKLFINGKEETLNNPNDATKFGISVVHQERNLIRRFSVGENLMLNNLPKTALGLIDYDEITIKSKKWLEIMDLDIDPKTVVSELTVAKMQLCEIAKALSLRAKILLLDEPTSSLSPQESENLFALLKKIVRDEGVSIVFVS
ncbi:MAG: ATP-binding cassette domain-containing protein, partial [Flavobacteriales bacterium]